MAKRKPSRVHVGIGPPVPLVPVGDFASLDPKMVEQAWQIVGPSVARNLENYRPVALWRIFAACYLEGFNHGVGITRELEGKNGEDHLEVRAQRPAQADTDDAERR